MTTIEKPVTQARQCSRCILDTHDDPGMSFDEQGVCSYCNMYDALPKYDFSQGDPAKSEREAIISKIKASGKGKDYDCLIGLSGGVDSTYLAYQAHKMGLRPLAVHFDNGWNSELAVKNIENVVSKLGIDLYTYVIDWEEFRDMQVAFFKASVIDIEALTDHAIYAALIKLASKNKIKYMLSGNNIATEAILPSPWIYKDFTNIKDIQKRFGTRPIKSYPHLGYFQRLYYLNIKQVETIQILNYMPYDKDDAKKTIIEELEWRDYGGKHYESIFTRFYQGYILPTKFKVDKRKAHLSSLICSGQLTKEEALEELKLPIYDADLLEEDKEFVLKKLKFTEKEFDELMKMPPIPHKAYGHTKSFFEQYPFLKFLRPLIKNIRRY